MFTESLGHLNALVATGGSPNTLANVLQECENLEYELAGITGESDSASATAAAAEWAYSGQLVCLLGLDQLPLARSLIMVKQRQ